MRRSGLAAQTATQRSLEDEIAHLRDLDRKGLRARWKGTFRRQPPLHLPRHVLFAILAYRLQADASTGLLCIRQRATVESPRNGIFRRGDRRPQKCP